jgi:hypothetical protein
MNAAAWVKCEEQSEDHRNEDAAIECRCYSDKFSGCLIKKRLDKKKVAHLPAVPIVGQVSLVCLQTDTFRLFLYQQTDNGIFPFAR